MPASPERVAAMRAFNRFYTRRIGVLNEGLSGTEFTLAQSRVLWELAHHQTLTAAALARELNLDAGYLSRLLRGLKERGLIKSARSPDDARQQRLSLSAAGRKAFAPLDARSQQEIAALLDTLPDAGQERLQQALHTVEHLLGEPAAQKAPLLLRAHRPGDIGWVISRHGALYAQEYGWTIDFEALVARIASDFIEQFDPAREACWIAERGGVNLGSVFLVQARDAQSRHPEAGVAQLRMLLVEPAARGLGLGAALVRECERFARHAGYQTIRLWTHSLLLAARGIYDKAGYRLVASEPHHSFGHDLMAETWELKLA